MNTKTPTEAAALLKKYGRDGFVPVTCRVGTSPHRALIEELARLGMQATQIARVIKKEKGDDADVPPRSISRHAHKECRCPTQK